MADGGPAPRAPSNGGRTPSRPLVAPLFAALAAEVDGTAPMTFLRDAGRMAVVLRDLARALPLDVLVVDSGSLWDLELAGFAVGREAFPPAVVGGAAAGVPDSVDVARRRAPLLEALQRLKDTVAPPTVLGVVVTGPARAAALAGAGRLDPAAWARSLHVIVRLVLEAGASVVLVHEGPAAPADAAAWSRDLAPVWGTVRFYRGTGALLLTDPEPAWSESVCSGRASGAAIVVDESAPEVLAAAAGRGPWGLACRLGSTPVAAIDGAVLITTSGDLHGQVTVGRLAETVRAMAAGGHA